MNPSAAAPRPSALVLSTGHGADDARLGRLRAALERGGFAASLTALAPDGPPATAPGTRTLPRAGKLRRAARSLWLPLAARADVLVVVDPDTIPAAVLSRRLRRRVVVCDVHEDYEALVEDRSWAPRPLRPLIQAVARACVGTARRADLVLVADDHLRPDGIANRVVVRNLPSRSELPEPTDPAPVPRALYIGDVRRSRGAVAMIDAVVACPPWELDVIGKLWGRDRPEILAAAGRAPDRIRVHGPLPLHDAWAHARGAWVGLLLLEDTPAFRAALPTKLYEYLLAGLVVITTDLPRTAGLVRSAGAGVVISSTEEVTTTLQRLREEPETFDRLRAGARAWASREIPHESPFDEAAARIRQLTEGMPTP